MNTLTSLGVKVDKNPGWVDPPKGSDGVIYYSIGLISRMNQSSSCPQILLRLVEGSKAPWYRQYTITHAPPIDRPSSSTSFSLPPLPPLLHLTISGINVVSWWFQKKKKRMIVHSMGRACLNLQSGSSNLKVFAAAYCTPLVVCVGFFSVVKKGLLDFLIRWSVPHFFQVPA
jgi:hypothetical protein